MLINLVVFIKIIHQVLYDIYFLQFKEYRFDRIHEHVKRKWGNYFTAYLYLSVLSPLSKQVLPFKTGKVVLLFLLTMLFYLPIFIVDDVLILLFALVTTPLVTFCISGLLTPIEKIVRLIKYKKAQEKIEVYKKNGLIVIGISGTYGKTTTKYFLKHVLSSKYKVLATERSINTPLGITNVILRELKPTHDFFIVEMAAYKIGEIKQMCEITSPHIGILTAISNQHLSLFGSQENIIKGKSELLAGLSENALALINKNSPHAPIIPKGKKITYQYYPPKTLDPLLEKSNVPDFLKQNIVPALIIGKKYGIKGAQIEKLIQNMPLPVKTMNMSKGKNGCFVIDDSFSANPEGFSAGVNYLHSLPYKNKMLVMMCLIELGKDSFKVHKNIGAQLKKLNINTIVTTSDFFAQIQEGSKNSPHIKLTTNIEMVKKELERKLDANTAVLIEGKVNQNIIDFIKNA